MNNEQKIIKVIYYVLDQSVYDGMESVNLLRVAVYEGTGQQGEEYYDGEWHRFDGALSYYPDPSPGVYIDEEKAKEIMQLIDREDGIA